MTWLLTLAFDGTEYCGFQVQPNGRSLAAAFQDALEAVIGFRPGHQGVQPHRRGGPCAGLCPQL